MKYWPRELIYLGMTQIEIAFTGKLRADEIQGILAAIQFRFFRLSM